MLRVVESLSRVDRESWAYVSQHGTENEVLDYLKDANLQRLNLDKIAFRMQDKQFFQTVIDLLARRHVYRHTLWSYGIKHNVVPAVRVLVWRQGFFDFLGGKCSDSGAGFQLTGCDCFEYSAPPCPPRNCTR